MGRLTNGWTANTCERNCCSGAFTQFQLSQAAFCLLISKSQHFHPLHFMQKQPMLDQAWPKAGVGQRTGFRPAFGEDTGGRGVLSVESLRFLFTQTFLSVAICCLCKLEIDTGVSRSTTNQEARLPHCTSYSDF